MAFKEVDEFFMSTPQETTEEFPTTAEVNEDEGPDWHFDPIQLLYADASAVHGTSASSLSPAQEQYYLTYQDFQHCPKCARAKSLDIPH